MRKQKAISRDRIQETTKQLDRSAHMNSERDYAITRIPNTLIFGGIDPRRRQELADGGMVMEDNNEVANLSMRPIHREYPKNGYYCTPFLDDVME